MAYRKQKEVFLSGSLSLLAPGDKVSSQESLELTNWRTDQAGMLLKRPGIAEVASLLYGEVNAALKANSGTYYGRALNLWKDIDYFSGETFDGKRLGLVEYQDAVWIMNRERQRQDSALGGLQPWTVAAPSTAPAGTGSGSGPEELWRYYVTFGTNRNEESNPSPSTDTIPTNGGTVNLTSIPVSGAGNVTKRHIYRLQPDFGAPLRVGTINNNTATTFADTLSAEDAILDGIEMPRDHDPAPAARCAIFFEGRIMAFSSAAHPVRAWWTPIAEPYYFPGSGAEVEIEGGNWQDVGADGDPILWASVHRRMVIVYKRRSIWRYPGDPDENDPEQTSAQRGLVGEQALTTAGNVDYFVSDDGVYRFNGDFETEISGAIRPLFQDRTVELAPGVSVLPINRSYIHKCALGFQRGRLYFSYPEAGAEQNSRTLVYDLAFERWYSFTHQVLPDEPWVRGFSCFAELGATGLVGGTRYGKVYQIEASSQSDQGGAAVPLVWQSRFLNQGLFDNPKRYGELVVEHRTHLASETACTLTVKLLFDNGAESLTLGTISSSSRTKMPFVLNSGEGLERENVSLRIEGNSQASTAIFSAYLHFYPVERRAKAFDTDVVDLGTPEVKQVERFEAELTSATQWDWKLFSDIPGLAMAQRATGSIAGAAARQVPQVGLSSLVDGRRFRLVGTGTQFQLHSLRMRMRTIAAYIVANVPWQSRVMDFGTPGPKELYEVEMEYESDSGGTLTVDSDLPGNSLALRATRVIPVSATPRTVAFSLAGVEGRRFQWQVAATSILKIHRLRVKLRPIGVYIDGANGAIWETQPLGFGHELCTLFREVELDCDTSGTMTFRLLTDRPGESLVERVAQAFDTESTTTGRRRVQVRFSGTTRGHLAKFRIDGVNTLKLYGAKVLHKPIGLAGVTPWQWTPLPVPPTPDSWQSAAVDGMGETSDWVWVSLPVDAIE
jgi:hypothetical protein